MVSGILTTWTAATALILGLFLVPPAVAQAPDAPGLSPENTTLYAHHNDDGDSDDEFVGYMNTLEADPDSDDASMGGGDNTPEFVLELNPALTETVILDPEGTIAITAYVGASSNIGDISVTTQLLLGSEVVADGEGEDALVIRDYETIEWELEPKITRLEAGMNLTWKISVTGTSTGAMFLSVSEDTGKSNIVLPVLSVEGGGAGEPEMFDLVGDTAEIFVSFDNETNATHIYNWTTNLTSAEFSYMADLNGTVDFEVIDGANMSVLVGVVTGMDSGMEPIENATEGPWTIRLNFTSVTGSIEITIGEVGSSPTPTDDGTGGNTTTNETGDAQGAEGEGGIPGPSVALAAASIALVAWLARRNRSNRRP